MRKLGLKRLVIAMKLDATQLLSAGKITRPSTGVMYLCT